MILKIFYKDEFDIFTIQAFHASKVHFNATLMNGTVVKNEDLKNWIQISVFEGSKKVYTLRR
jgi:hypothetical protein